MSPLTFLLSAALATCAAAASLPSSYPGIQTNSPCSTPLPSVCNPANVLASIRGDASMLRASELGYLGAQMARCRAIQSMCSSGAGDPGDETPEDSLERRSVNDFDPTYDVLSWSPSDSTLLGVLQVPQDETQQGSAGEERVDSLHTRSARAWPSHVQARRNIFNDIGGAFTSAADKVSNFATDTFGPNVKEAARATYDAAKYGHDAFNAALGEQAPELSNSAGVLADELPAPVAGAVAEDGALEAAAEIALVG